jgi:hypothetical protein
MFEVEREFEDSGGVSSGRAQETVNLEYSAE